MGRMYHDSMVKSHCLQCQVLAVHNDIGLAELLKL
uniref:Uncharacterized protein n=1 Tax=Anopheles quadriannulatus TaxID=34691 RepID=A0A182XTY7_ANOQN